MRSDETTLPYYGLGNAASEPNVTNVTRDDYWRVHPALSINARWALDWPVFLDAGVQYTYNEVSFDPSSTLAQDMHSADPYIRETVAIVPNHSVLRLQGAVVDDTRDNPVSPYDGQYHQIELRVSPRLGNDLPYAYQQIHAQARFYYTPIPRYLTLTARGVLDLQLGDVPFYEARALRGDVRDRRRQRRAWRARVQLLRQGEDVRELRGTLGDVSLQPAPQAVHPRLRRLLRRRATRGPTSRRGGPPSTAPASGCTGASAVDFACRRVTPSSCAPTSRGRPTRDRSEPT